MIKGSRTKAARRMRKEPTSAERYLWKCLRKQGLEGLRFRRQVPFGPYVADFVCYSHRLVVELDGPFHDAGHDQKRDVWMRAQGFEVLRFPVLLIHSRPHQALKAIQEAAARRPPVLNPMAANFLPPP